MYMPYSDIDDNTNFNMEEFITSCDSSQIEEIVHLLKIYGFLPESVTSFYGMNNMSISEKEYEEALIKLHGKWNRLSSEQEQTIINISKKF